jgi:hypothetical protein
MPDWSAAEDTTLSGSSQDLSMFYSFDVGPTHFISINTEAYYFLNYGAHQIIRQYNWLIKDLEVCLFVSTRSRSRASCRVWTRTHRGVP